MVQSSLQSSKNNGVENKKNDSFPKGPNLKRKKIEGPPASETRQEGGSRQGQERQAAFHEDLLQGRLRCTDKVCKSTERDRGVLLRVTE